MVIGNLMYAMCGDILFPAQDTYLITPSALRDKINRFSPVVRRPVAAWQLECWTFISKKHIYALNFGVAFTSVELSWSSPVVKALLPKSSFQDLLQPKSLLILTWLTFVLQTITLVHEQEIQYTWLDPAPHLHVVLRAVHPLTIQIGVPPNQAMEQLVLKVFLQELFLLFCTLS